VFGIATNALHKSLSKTALAHLNTKNFSVQQPTECINQIVEKVLYFNKILLENTSGLKLGAIPFKSLLEKFAQRDLSVDSFVKGIQVF
jgi:hypothetical protein